MSATAAPVLHKGHSRPYGRVQATPRDGKAFFQGDTSLPPAQNSGLRAFVMAAPRLAPLWD